jgi:ADP-heptose:LPS heptosyltransferase
LNETPAPRLLFVPVSGRYGAGEYARSLAIARAAAAQWPGAAVHFMLSREAPYAADPPFPATLLPSSPTFHSADVIAVIHEFRPDIVVFDNAGRTAQLRAAQRSGARVVYISARSRQRRKAFRWRWMRLIDEHWIAYPQFVAGGLSFLEQLKLRLMESPAVRYLDVILSKIEAADNEAANAKIPYPAGSYVLVIPGGGTGHPGAMDAVGEFRAAANILAAAGAATVFVGPAGAASSVDAVLNLRSVGMLPQPQLAVLMHGAKLIVTNGGSTLLQAIACAKACIAVPIAKDQVKRIEHCVAAGVAVEAPLQSAGIVRIAHELLLDEAARAGLAARAAALGLADGVDVALAALEQLITTRSRV